MKILYGQEREQYEDLYIFETYEDFKERYNREENLFDFASLMFNIKGEYKIEYKLEENWQPFHFVESEGNYYISKEFGRGGKSFQLSKEYLDNKDFSKIVMELKLSRGVD